ncbi:o-succinylbenzoate--CoA ligase [Knoellia locipacati]|uniref:Putative O-succinylbenzoic acid--CoA ligase MenE n=1 Tax=Knoellia locipacati TaxID=882824 RepID=A0A512T119_9MICO|nr:o-succinylbenzoate--CoA ligase [Knoellia locipacati]GEQ13880.1 putative O-succinylbenzoic acid--CoA ligase MenE [Knoellia locipacati]
MRIEPLAVPAGAAALEVLPRLALALEGGSPVAPYAVGSPPPDLAPAAVDEGVDEPPAGLAVAIGTSGSTGAPKRAMLTAANLRSSIDATAARLGGHGQWLLTVPGHHIAGLQVLLRSVVAGTTPHVMDLSDGFSPATWVAAVDAMPDTDLPTYVSVVPTQLTRLLADDDATGRLARFTAVLVGGAATHPDLLTRAAAAGVTAVTTYGMSETAGGCVYDGRPLDGMSVDLDTDGRISLRGATVASGYLGDPARTHDAFPSPGTFRTDDIGHLDPDGRLRVDGRIDDLVNTGGLKVAPRLVEEAVSRLDGISEAVAVGVPDPEWGEVLAVVVVRERSSSTPGPAPTVSGLREQLRGILPDHALPRAVREVDAIPVRGPGKPDRAAIRALFGAVGE